MVPREMVNNTKQTEEFGPIPVCKPLRFQKDGCGGLDQVTGYYLNAVIIVVSSLIWTHEGRQVVLGNQKGKAARHNDEMIMESSSTHWSFTNRWWWHAQIPRSSTHAMEIIKCLFKCWFWIPKNWKRDHCHHQRDGMLQDRQAG